MTSIGTEAMSNENESQRQIESSRTPDAREVDNSVGKRDRPAMAIYRPRQARVGGESSQKNEHDDQHKTDDQVGQVSRPSERIPEEDKALQETIFEMASNPDETSQQTDCSLLYDYESFRMDLTSSRVWEDQPKKKTYLELKPSSNSRCHWDPTWQLRAPDNGFFSFTAQPSEAHDARIVVHLSTQKGQLTTFYEVEVDTVKHSCKIRHVSNENLIETCENGPSNLQQASSSCRPPPQSFWIAYRHGTIAVGKGTRLVDSTILCNMRASVIERGIQAIGFSVPSDAKNISLSRIFFGKKLCRNVASLSHIRLIKANDSIFEEVINRKRTRNHFENLPSVITWNSNVGSRMFENELLRHIQEVVGCDNVAFRCKFPSWGWAIFSSCGAADKLQADLLGMREKGKFAQVQVMRCEEATREELLASGLPVTRDRPKATARVANRLISSALKGVMSGNNRRR
ncbi:hypothetical protein GUITHDRAFT_160905 [Guillardia theta CCMP2712]|uniref:Uncharacterized protein n=2 Tax=Guillardia theta TaxID=55529 RepID=L1K010_GUITC|nr:hypothetical protein GUITHDRAFT_160905 [Guillardia theta CCMP2712]EKX53708.1 hypothetical protein GUITHDRAFT_160905 [Guillardia theta CCMP2712]|eukprot:XP_005840688.1 hypothetical protein GUITHDRAFT_160905 [Guillardia theta CCMP2712]